ncbi:MAG: serine/threonine protein kinase, partial [Myxococcota bacterium]|nr:serine/threonine protein kinase [Myxococcota bacterium]
MKSLGSGAVAELLLARAAPTERPLVLKYVRPEDAVDGPFLETFIAEGRRSTQLHHPNIVKVHEVGREDGTHYLATEYVHGDDVRKLLARLHERRAKLPIQHLIAITTAVATAVHHAHEQRDPDDRPLNILHLHLDPSNVIIAADGTVKVADFGITRAAFVESRVDQLGPFISYMSPEQVTGHALDRRTDVFGIGVLMYELATGRPLFKSENDFLTMATIAAGDIPPPTRHRGDLPKELETIILRALARAPEDRYETVLELHDAIDQFAAKAGVRGSLTTLAGYTKRLFGVRPEPWLVEEEVTELLSAAAIDGIPKGLATPPIEAVQGVGLPGFVVASASSPLQRARRQVSRDQPTEQLNIGSLAKAVADKSVPVKIPAPAPAAPKAMPAVAGRSSTRSMPVVTPPTAVRIRPKTVQIPVHAADRIVNERIEKAESKLPPPPQSFHEDTAAGDDTLTNDTLVNAELSEHPLVARAALAALHAADDADPEETKPNIPMQSIASKPSGNGVGARAPQGANGATSAGPSAALAN